MQPEDEEPLGQWGDADADKSWEHGGQDNGEERTVGLDIAKAKVWVETSPFKLLSARVLSRLRLDYAMAGSIQEIEKACSALVNRSRGSRALRPQTAAVMVHWSPLKFLSEQGYKNRFDSLRTALTISGQAGACQMLPCKEYLQQVWPVIGETIMDAILEAGVGLGTPRPGKKSAFMLTSLPLGTLCLDKKFPSSSVFYLAYS